MRPKIVIHTWAYSLKGGRYEKKGENPVTQIHDEVVDQDKDRLKLFFWE
jgi:hypothetical protein